MIMNVIAIVTMMMIEEVRCLGVVDAWQLGLRGARVMARADFG